PLHDLVFVIVFFQLQSLENLQKLSLDGDIVVLGDVLDELLGDGGAAEGVFHAQEHVHESAYSAVPVHALVGIEVVILNGHGGVLHVQGDLVQGDPLPALRAVKGGELLVVAVVVRIPDGAGEGDGHVLQGQGQLRRQAGFDIIGKDAGKQKSRAQ